MPVNNRIKILKCSSLDDAENQVNDFLAFDEKIAQLLRIEFQLEYNIVIIEYSLFNDINGDDDELSTGGGYHYTTTRSFTNPYLDWMTFCCNPFGDLRRF
jgi:hypothetical protein